MKELPSGLVLEGDENEAADAKDKLDIEPATPPKDSEGAAVRTTANDSWTCLPVVSVLH